jgi:hypothetical protein
MMTILYTACTIVLTAVTFGLIWVSILGLVGVLYAVYLILCPPKDK